LPVLLLAPLQPTNQLDLEAIDSLADAIKRFKGGMVLVSHDFRLIDQVANEIWVCENGTVTRWDGLGIDAISVAVSGGPGVASCRQA
jgi:ATP-binding cassette subfamily F protein 2